MATKENTGNMTPTNSAQGAGRKHMTVDEYWKRAEQLQRAIKEQYKHVLAKAKA